MTLVNIVSALGNNNSIYPLLVRDCGIENVAKVTMTYNQNVKDSKFIAKQATRERIIDEYGTSAVWLGGIPLMSWLSDKCIKASGLNPSINLKLYNETEAQGISKNIEKFKNIATNITTKTTIPTGMNMFPRFLNLYLLLFIIKQYPIL